MDYDIIMNAIGKISEGVNMSDIGNILLFCLIAGFLSLTSIYILLRKDENWVKMDIYSKAAASIIVGMMSYLVVILGTWLYNVIKLLITEKYDDVVLTKSGFVFMILYSFLIICLLKKRNQNAKIDKLQILKFIEFSSFLLISLFFLTAGLLFIAISIDIRQISIMAGFIFLGISVYFYKFILNSLD